MKGLHLNLSNSGLSLNAGIKGASVTMGKKGTFVNVGIPGTGLSNRINVSSNTHKTQTNNLTRNDDINVSIGLDNNGAPILSLKDSAGNEITNQTIISKVKHTDKYKQSVERLIAEKKQEIDEGTEKFINISKYTPEIISEQAIRNKLEELKPQTYTPHNFSKQAPQKDLIKNMLKIEASECINEIFFWKNRGLREKFVDENLDVRFNQKMNDWQIAKQEFDEKEDTFKKARDQEFLSAYLNEKMLFEKILSGDTNFIEERIENIISEITLPADFHLNYEYQPEFNQLKIDLDLPEIENMPQEKATILASGKISIKNKTQKEIKQEYSKCVCGIALYLGGLLFNISPSINEIVISGFTQRINKSTGNMEDQYIYSVKFLRDKFTTLNFKNIDPLLAFSNFENHINMTNDNEFKAIAPW